jgi:hypothetical protein
MCRVIVLQFFVWGSASTFISPRVHIGILKVICHKVTLNAIPIGSCNWYLSLTFSYSTHWNWLSKTHGFNELLLGTRSKAPAVNGHFSATAIPYLVQPRPGFGVQRIHICRQHIMHLWVEPEAPWRTGSLAPFSAWFWTNRRIWIVVWAKAVVSDHCCDEPVWPKSK